MVRPLILVTNDDGIDSPGLAACVAALDPLGELLIVAPVSQQTSMSRSRTLQGYLDGRLIKRKITYGEKSWDAIAANAPPALTVEHGVQEIAKRKVDLVVSGINYGENIGTCVTVSGTIGAALEAAERGIPALAVSLELEDSDYYSNEKRIEFSAAIHFLRLFTKGVLHHHLPKDVDVLKIEIPAHATPQTCWMITRQDRLSYYTPIYKNRSDIFNSKGILEFRVGRGKFLKRGTDAYALAEGFVSVTPLSLDLTSRVRLKRLQRLFR